MTAVEPPARQSLQWTSRDYSVAIAAAPAEVGTALPRMWSRIVRATGNIATPDWERPTRCSEWRVVDLVNHLSDLTEMSRESLLAWEEGRRTVVFDGFDPRRTPGQLVTAVSRDPQAAQQRLVASVEQLLAVLDRVDVADPAPAVQGPLGRQPAAASLMHVLWDTWLHERDLLLPLGQSVPELEDELRLAAVYTLRMVGFVHRLFGREAHVTLGLRGGYAGVLRLDVDATQLRIADATESEAMLRGDTAVVVDALCGRGDLQSALDGPAALRDELGSLSGLLGGA